MAGDHGTMGTDRRGWTSKVRVGERNGRDRFGEWMIVKKVQKKGVGGGFC